MMLGFTHKNVHCIYVINYNVAWPMFKFFSFKLTFTCLVHHIYIMICALLQPDTLFTFTFVVHYNDIDISSSLYHECVVLGFFVHCMHGDIDVTLHMSCMHAVKVRCVSSYYCTLFHLLAVFL